jgi:Spy/CpxP family protein refolding chaperone
MKATRVMRHLVLATAMIAAPALLFAAGTGQCPWGHGKGMGGPGGPGHGHGPGEMGQGPGGGFGFGLHFLERMGDSLGLTDEQRTQIETILNEGQPAIEDLRIQMDEAREAFFASYDPTQFNEAAIRAFAESQAALHTEMMVARERLHSQVLSVLTAEQREQLKEMRGDCMHRHGGQQGGHHGGWN